MMSETHHILEPLENSVDSSLLSNGRKKKREGPYRGPSRALKYRKLRRSQAARIPVDIPKELGAAVGERALQFIAECADWVKDICPLNVKKWKDMPADVLDRLYGKIKGKYVLPDEEHVLRALKIQRSNLYRHWRERLKKKYFANNTCLRDVEHNCPAGIDVEQWKWLVYNYWSSPAQRERSEKNRAAALSKVICSRSGAKSIARVIHELDGERERSETTHANSSNSDAQTEMDCSEPKYIELWKKTKSNANGIMDEEAVHILRKFRELHLKEIEEKGSDNLTIEEAYQNVLGHASGYARGLGRAHPIPSKKVSMWRSELQIELEQLRAREKELRAEIVRKEQEALEREAKREDAAREREARLRNDFMAELAKFSGMITKLTGVGAG